MGVIGFALVVVVGTVGTVVCVAGWGGSGSWGDGGGRGGGGGGRGVVFVVSICFQKKKWLVMRIGMGLGGYDVVRRRDGIAM